MSAPREFQPHQRTRSQIYPWPFMEVGDTCRVPAGRWSTINVAQSAVSSNVVKWVADQPEPAREFATRRATDGHYIIVERVA